MPEQPAGLVQTLLGVWITAVHSTATLGATVAKQQICYLSPRLIQRQ